MMSLSRAVLGGLLLSTLAGAPAHAQELDRRCQRIVDALCEGGSVGRCFRDQSMWDNVPQRCTGDVQTMIETEREANAERARPRPRPRVAGPSFACGGILRSRPSQSGARVASIAQGQEFQSVEDTGIWMDGYKWFRVSVNGFEGYKWGGIFWTEGGREGTIPSCDG